MSPRLSIFFEKAINDGRWPLIIIVLFALLISYSLWQVGAVFKIKDVDVNRVNTQVVVPTVADISQQHLFGQYDESMTDLPPTQLQLRLQGIAMGVADNDGSRALIATTGGLVKVYKMGDSVPGGAIIHQILRDRVILDQNGRFESLNLPVPDVTGTITEAH